MDIKESFKRLVTEDGVEYLSAYAITSDAKLLRKFGPVSNHPNWTVYKRGFFDAQWDSLRDFLMLQGFKRSYPR